MIKAYQYGRASVVGPFDYGQLIGAALVGFLWFGEVVDLWTWLGAALIVASGLYIARREALQGGGGRGPKASLRAVIRIVCQRGKCQRQKRWLLSRPATQRL